MEIDHLIVTAASLDEGATWVEERLGLPLEPGGRHDRFATHNRLLSLGPGLYLEVIAPEPRSHPGRPRWFGLDAARGPSLRHWAARVPDLAAAPPESGQPLDLARGPYAWSVTIPPDGSLPWGGAYPTLLAWRSGHPADALPDRGARLLALELGDQRAPRLRALLAPLADPRVSVVTADAPTLRARLSTPHGEVEL